MPLSKNERKRGREQTHVAERFLSVTPPPKRHKFHDLSNLTQQERFYAAQYPNQRPHNGTPRRPAKSGVSRLEQRIGLLNTEQDVEESSQDKLQEQFSSVIPPLKCRSLSGRSERLSVEDQVFRLKEMIELLTEESCSWDRRIFAILHQNNLRMHRNSQEEALKHELFQRLSEIIALLRDRAFLRATMKFEEFCHFINSGEFVGIYGADLVRYMLEQLDPLLATTAIIERRSKMALPVSKSAGDADDCSFRLDEPVEQAEDAALCAESIALLQDKMENLKESCREKELRLACEVSRCDQLAQKFSVGLGECKEGVVDACSEISRLCLQRPIVFRFFNLPQALLLRAGSCKEDRSVRKIF